ncbi:hypothetical protein HQN87_03890 [Paenibacillus tritici]|uniref:Uncharacterized protein n=1 Tax=Paenibacillus tritici TaxID=1873425 RepID=A0ABX2DK69_9BACL|nr:hypothetical protein [Paenibacillus tritici]NQX44463.1 hypothetical protein [Paenibacillus tritici]
MEKQHLFTPEMVIPRIVAELDDKNPLSSTETTISGYLSVQNPTVPDEQASLQGYHLPTCGIWRTVQEFANPSAE